MASYKEIYSQVQSGQRVAEKNKQTIFSNLELTPKTLENLTLNGVVYSPTLNPLSGAVVAVYDENGETLAKTSTTTGIFQLVFQGETKKTYRATASVCGYCGQTEEVTFQTLFNNCNFILSKEEEQKVVFGWVKNEEGEPVAGSCVTMEKEGTILLSMITDDKGAFMAEYPWEEDETYTMTADALDYEKDQKEILYSEKTKNQPVLFTLPVEHKNITSIQGKIVIAGTTTPIADALVGLFLIENGKEQLVKTTKTDAAGQYTFCDILGDATYIVRAAKVEEV